MGRHCSFAVEGTPRPWKRPSEHVDRRTGHIVRHPDPATKAAEKVIAQLARLHWRGPPATGPVILRVIAIFAVPASWPRKIHAAAREARVPHIADPDLDRLINLVQDALVGIAYVDDNQVVSTGQSAKRYGKPERTEITIQELNQQPDEITPGQRRIEAEALKQGWQPHRLQMLPLAAESNPSKTKRRQGS